MDAQHTSDGWGLWRRHIEYLFSPEDSAAVTLKAGQNGAPCWAVRLKIAVWISLSTVTALVIAQL